MGQPKHGSRECGGRAEGCGGISDLDEMLDAGTDHVHPDYDEISGWFDSGDPAVLARFPIEVAIASSRPQGAWTIAR